MAKKKFTLSEIKVKGLAEQLPENEQKRIEGGYITSSRRGRIRLRWTSVDTRKELFLAKKDETREDRMTPGSFLDA